MSEAKGIKCQTGESKQVVIRQGEQTLEKRIAVPAVRPERRIGGAKEVILQMADDFNEPLVDFAEYMA
jgi:hypothetical protein